MDASLVSKARLRYLSTCSQAKATNHLQFLLVLDGYPCQGYLADFQSLLLLFGPLQLIRTLEITSPTNTFSKMKVRGSTYRQMQATNHLQPNAAHKPSTNCIGEQQKIFLHPQIYHQLSSWKSSPPLQEKSHRLLVLEV
jgi:hypothetical protein